MDREAWRGTVHGFAKSQTQLSNQAQHINHEKGRQRLQIFLYCLESSLAHRDF